MNLERAYDPKLKPLFPEPTEQFLTDLPPEATYGRPKSLAEAAPGEREVYLAELIKSNQFDLRNVEVGAKAIAGRISILRELIDQHPEVVAALPEELRAQVESWASLTAESEPPFPELTA